MKAIVYKTFGPPDVLKLVNHPLPQRSAGELLVKVKSTSVNPVDYKTRNGSIPIAKKNKVVLYVHRSSRTYVGISHYTCMQILGGDLAGVVESADVDSKVFSLLVSSQHVHAKFPSGLQLVKGDKVFGLSPDFIFTSKWGVWPFCGQLCKHLLHQLASYTFSIAGTYAEFATIKSSLVASIPDNTSFDQAAALPLVSLTAMQVCQSSVRQHCY